MGRKAPSRPALVASALMVLVPLVAPGWVVFVLTLALAKFLVVLSVGLFLKGGLISFGHALYYAVGAYTVGFAVKWFGLREALALLPLGGLLGAGVASLVGLVMARHRRVFFAMLDLAFSMILYGALLKLYWVTGGTDGIGVGTPQFFGLAPPREIAGITNYYFTLVVVGVVIYAIYRFVASPLGFFLKALLDNEIRIEYSGESTRRVVYYIYILSGALGGMAGVVAAFTIGHVVPEYSHWIQSGEFIFIALLGGFESVPGPLIGAIAFEFIRTYASKYAPEAWQMTLGVIMLLIILFRPGGLWTIYEALASRFRRRPGEVASG